MEKDVEAVRPQKGLVSLRESIIYFCILYLRHIGLIYVYGCLCFLVYLYLFYIFLFFVNILLYTVKDIVVLRPCLQTGKKGVVAMRP